MSKAYENFRDKAFSAFQSIAKDFPEYEDALQLVGSADASAKLVKSNTFKNIDTEWIDAIEQALPALDTIIRNPSVAIEDVDEILPVEVSRHITEKSIKHLAQHTNLILDIKGDDVTPQKILNVYHDETYLTYENKFVNTLLARLSAFVDKRYRALAGGNGTEENHKFEYSAEFEHFGDDEGGRNSAHITLSIELTSPLDSGSSESNTETNESYSRAIERVKRINMALMSYQSSYFAERLGRNYIRPPVIRTNAILKNKNLKECLTLWDFIEGFDKVGYQLRTDNEMEMPSDGFIRDLYSSVALQYVNFYKGVTESNQNRMLSKKRSFDVEPEFESDLSSDELDEYRVYDSEYKKTVPVSRLLNSKKRLSEDEKRISDAISVALKADDLLMLEEQRRIEAERKLLELEKKRIEEEEAKRRAEEERLFLLEQARIAEEKRRAEEEQRLLREAKEAERRAEEERLARLELERIAEEQRIKAEAEAKRKAEAKLKYAKPRKGSASVPEYTFLGETPIDSVVFIPYKREVYLNMPRKRKKQVLMKAVNASRQSKRS